MAAQNEEVRGMAEAMKQAQAGMALFKQEGEVQTDRPAAEAFKATHDAMLAEMQTAVDALTGKDNKKERAAKSKEMAEFKVNKQYIDACKIVKGLEPVNGFFVLKSAESEAKSPAETAAVEPAANKFEPDAKKAPKSAKKADSAGLSPAEKKELEQLKDDVVARKTQLKAAGLSGGQQNKDPQVVEWVTRMNELKEKESPGSTQKPEKADKKKKALSADVQKAADQLKQEIEDYKVKLKTEFGYSNKDMKADPELQEMEARLQGLA